MIENEVFVNAIRDALMFIPVATYFGICIAVACELDGFGEWFSSLFDFSRAETVGDYLLELVHILFGLALTPGALIYYTVRLILRINISHIGKDAENEDCNFRR